MIVINLSDLILIGIIAVLIIISILIYIIKSILNKFKDNCYKCKHYSLYDVASFGDYCRYRCNKFDRIDEHHMNDSTNYVKCKEFTNKEDVKHD